MKPNGWGRVPRVARVAVAAASGIASVLSARAASAQERARLDLFPHVPSVMLVSPLFDRDERERWSAFATGSFADAVPAGPVLLSPSAGAGAGWRGPDGQFVLGYAEGTLPVHIGDGAMPFALRDIDGSGRIAWRLGSGNVKGKLGFDVELHAWIDHAGPQTTSWLRLDRPGSEFAEVVGEVTLRPRYGIAADQAWALPVTYHEELLFSSIPGTSSARDSFSSGLDLAWLGKKAVTGSFRLLGGTYEQVRIGDLVFHDPVSGDERTRFATPPDIERVDLDALRAKRFFHVIGTRDTLEGSTHVGGAWLYDARHNRQLSAFTFSLAAGVRRHEASDAGGDLSGGFGLGVERRAGFLADGSYFTRSWRIEGFVDFSSREHAAGARIAMALENLEIPEDPSGTRDLPFAYLLATEWFLRLGRGGVHLGAHHTMTSRCPTAWQPEGTGTCHVLGVFLRVSRSGAK